MKDKEMEKLIDACYDVMFQREAEMEELGLLNYGDSSYYIQNPDEYEKDKKICELENEVERLEHRLANCIEPKFKKGDLVFANTVAYWENEKPIRHTTQQEVEEIVYFYKLKNYDFKNWEIDEVFSTYNEAKEKLNEMQGDKR